MTDAAFNAWVTLSHHHITLVNGSITKADEASYHEADCIPDWAALAVAIGSLVALGSVVYAWIEDSNWALVALTIALIVAAVGMRAAEKSLQKPTWLSL
jgi:hypothetical protein